MVTRAKNGVFKPKLLDAVVILAEPSSVKEALKDPKWVAIQAKYETLMKNGTWELVPPPKHGKVIGSKWIFRTKLRADRSLDK